MKSTSVSTGVAYPEDFGAVLEQLAALRAVALGIADDLDEEGELKNQGFGGNTKSNAAWFSSRAKRLRKAATQRKSS